MIDAFLANDEVSLVRYRLRTHAAVVERTVIAEANVTMTGLPKPLHMRAAFTRAELRRGNVRLVTVPFASSRGNVSLLADALAKDTTYGLPRTPRSILADLRRAVDREGTRGSSNVNSALRFALNLAVSEELNALHAAGDGQLQSAAVYMSDVDEVLDATRDVRARVAPAVTGPSGCFLPKLRYLFYSGACAFTGHVQGRGLEWRRSLLFNGSSLRARLVAPHAVSVLTPGARKGLLHKGSGSFFHPRAHVFSAGSFRCASGADYDGWCVPCAWKMDQRGYLVTPRPACAPTVTHAGACVPRGACGAGTCPISWTRA